MQPENLNARIYGQKERNTEKERKQPCFDNLMIFSYNNYNHSGHPKKNPKA